MFERLNLDRAGSHEVHEVGGFGEPTGQTREWRFGDPFRIDLRATIGNAVLREGPSDGRVHLVPDDFMLAEAETRTSTATVLLLDMSRSMPMRGHWDHARRMTFALHTLIESQYPEDRLHIVGFSDYARVLRPTDLAAVEWEPVYGTNYEHAFLLAGRLLSKEVLGGSAGHPRDRRRAHRPPRRRSGVLQLAARCRKRCTGACGRRSDWRGVASR